MAQYFEQYRQSLEKMLYEPGKLNDWLTLAEQKAGVKRIYIALGMIAFCFYVVITFTPFILLWFMQESLQFYPFTWCLAMGLSEYWLIAAIKLLTAINLFHNFFF